MSASVGALADGLLWLAATIALYFVARRVFDASGHFALLHPVLVTIVGLIAGLVAFAVPFERYFLGGQVLHFLLGPATVCIAVPIHQYAPRLRRVLWPSAAALVAGGITGIASAVLFGAALDLPDESLRSLAPKSVTTPIAMGVAENAGGLPSLTAVLVIASGILGAVLAVPLLAALRVRDARARGLAIGVAAHGIGTARAFELDREAGAFAGLAMGLNGILTAFLVPLWF
jgi:predicted murein hydrolase (TIGR00659 family)